VWESTVDGRVLNFHLAGINNQNFIMKDEETGSWWQQVSGEAIHGPLKGAKLKPVLHDDLSFGIWKREQPNGRLLKPDPRVSSQYEPATWEERYARLRVVVPVDPADQLKPRALIVGISLNGAAKAYPVADLERQNPIIDQLGGIPLLIVLGTDRKSVRAFDRTVDGRVLELLMKPQAASQIPTVDQPPEQPLELFDAETGTTWDFTGRAVKGPLWPAGN
jgi:hypothetical protein